MAAASPLAAPVAMHARTVAGIHAASDDTDGYNSCMKRFSVTILALIMALLTFLLAGAFVVGCIETISVREAPLPATVNEGIARLKSHKSAWVQLSDATPDCQRYAGYTSRWADGARRSAVFVAVNAAKDAEIVVVAHDVSACEYLGRVHLIGEVKALDADERKKFIADGLPAAEMDRHKYWLCTWCVPEREWFALFLLLGLVLAAGAGTRAIWRGRG
jgi:hypothetical protein